MVLSVCLKTYQDVPETWFPAADVARRLAAKAGYRWRVGNRMSRQGLPRGTDEPGAEQAADLLAIALEDVGFDVGRDFPGLTSGAGVDGVGFVELGRVSGGVAWGLACVLTKAAGRGVFLRNSK